MPALINSFLFVEPKQHYLEYASLPLHDIVAQNRQAGQTITELIGDDANPDKIKQELAKTNSILFAGIGHGNCYSEDTEILTENGWMPFRDLSPVNPIKVATLSANHELEYQTPVAYQRMFFSGEMFCIEGKSINLCVTPKHNLFVSHPARGGWSAFGFLQANDIGKDGASWFIGSDEKSQRLIRLEQRAFKLRREGMSARKISQTLDLPLGTVQNWIFLGRKAGLRWRSTGKTQGHCLRFMRGAKWNCEELLAFTIPEATRNIKLPSPRTDTYEITIPAKSVLIDDWLRFFSIWLAEGSASELRKHYVISITQNNDEKRRTIKQWVDTVAKQVGFHTWEEASNDHSKAIKFKNKQVYMYLKQFGHAHDKFIPKEIKMLPAHLLEILIDAMVMGDGAIDVKGRISYSTMSKRLADDVQELVMKTGRSATIYKNRRTNLFTLYFRDKYACVAKRSMKRTKYTGHVYCVTVPNHIIYVRRNGRPCWCGNSGIYTVECTTPLLHADSPEELALMKSRVTSLCSCLTAQILGPAIIDAGALAYTGYKEEFWFYIGDVANSTRAVQSPFLAEFEFVGSLLRGRTTGEAREDQLKKYDEEVSYWTTGAGKDQPNAMELSRIIETNKNNSVFLGQGTIIPSPKTPMLISGISPIVVFPLGLLTVGYFIYRELQKP